MTQVADKKEVIKAAYIPCGKAYPLTLQSLFEAHRQTQVKFKQEQSLSRTQLARRLWRLRKRCRERAYQHGTQAAMKEQAQKIQGLENIYRELTHQAEQDCLQVALNVCNKILGDVWDKSPLPLQSQINAALSHLRNENRISIELNKSDYQKIEGSIASLNDIRRFTIKSTPGVLPGQLRLSSPCGQIDFHWKDHFKQVSLELFEKLTKRQSTNE